ncbi:MAG: hypothetical protein M3N08_02045 [Pseudomonadota bacterium]|nr:hypothetical protein [Pseudomonadota bacterium]
MIKRSLTFDDVRPATRAEWDDFRSALQDLTEQASLKMRDQFPAGSDGDACARQAYEKICRGYYTKNLQPCISVETAERFLAYQILIGNKDAQYTRSPNLDLPGKYSIKDFFEDVRQGRVRATPSLYPPVRPTGTLPQSTAVRAQPLPDLIMT